MKSKRGIRGVLALAASILILSTAGCGMTERIQDMAGRLFGGEEGQETEGETAAAEESGQEGTEENKDGGPSADGETIDGDSPLTREEFIQLLADGFGYDTSAGKQRVLSCGRGCAGSRRMGYGKRLFFSGHPDRQGDGCPLGHERPGTFRRGGKSIYRYGG